MSQPWRLRDQKDLVWRAWDGEMVMYRCSSGDIHHLDALSAEAFESLLQQEMDEETLAAQISSQWGVALDQDIATPLAEALVKLHAVGLVERVEQ